MNSHDRTWLRSCRLSSLEQFVDSIYASLSNLFVHRVSWSASMYSVLLQRKGEARKALSESENPGPEQRRTKTRFSSKEAYYLKAQ